MSFIARALVLTCVVAFGGCAGPMRALSEKQQGQVPPLNERVTAGVGDTIYSEFDYVATKGVMLPGGYEDGFFIGKVVVPVGQWIPAYKDGEGLKYCTRENRYSDPMMGPVQRACFRDTTGDANFDQVSVQQVGFGAWFDITPEPYVSSTGTDSSKGFKRELVYQGVAGGTLHLAYREYVNNLARPAFAQDAVYELQNPVTEVIFKGARIEVYKAGNMIEYKVVKSFTPMR